MRQGPLIAGLTLSLGLVGCGGFEMEGLDALVDDEESYVRFPGRQLVEGQFTELNHATSPTRGTVMLAWREERELTLVPVTGSEACTIEDADDYEKDYVFGAAEDPADLGFLAITEEFLATTEEGEEVEARRLRFVDLGCAELGAALEDGRSVHTRDGSPGDRAFARNGANDLHFFDFETGTWSLVAEGATNIIASDERIWSIEGGAIVGRDADLVEDFREGTAVTGLLRWGEASSLFALDADGLHSIDEDLDNLWSEPLAEDVCSLGLAWPWGHALTYHSPCAEGKLNVRKLDGTIAEVASGTAPSSVVEPTTIAEVAAEMVAYVTAGEYSGWSPVGTLHSGILGGTLHEIGERGLLSSVVPAAVAGYSFALVDWDGTTGRLVRWTPDGEVEELARGLTGYGPFLETYALVDFDGEEGTVVRMGIDGPDKVLGTGVPSIGSESFGLVAFLTDYDGETGTLMVAGEGLEPTEVATGVRSREFELATWAATAVIYRREVDEESNRGTLGIFFPETGDTFEVSEVTEWDAIWSPESGIAYHVDDGRRTGIWFAEIQ